jgi:hypothetical protein
VSRFELPESAYQTVVLRIGNDGTVENVIGVIVLQDTPAKLFEL